MSFSKNRFNSLLLSFSVLYFGITAVTAVLFHNPAIMLYFAVYLLLTAFMLFSNRAVALLIFLSLYGMINRIIFFFTGGFAYSLLFLIPLFVFLSCIENSFDRAKRLSLLSLQISLLYIILTLFFAVIGAGSSMLSSSVAAAAYLTPLLLASAVKMERTDFEKTLTAVAPLVLLLFAMQFFGFFFPFDRYYISKVSGYDFTSLMLGSHERPFSTFSSPEELSAFLSFSFLFLVSSNRRLMKVLSGAFLLSLLLLSARSAIFILLLSGIYFMIKTRKAVHLAVLFFLAVMTVISANMFVKDYTIYRTDSKAVAILKHTLEPFKNPLDSYSVERRIESLKNLAADIKKHPLGNGLSHAETATKGAKDEYPSESSAMKLVKSGGVLFFAFVIVLLVYAVALAVKSSDAFRGAYLIFFLSMFLFMNGMTMHLMSFLLSGYLFLSDRGEE